MIEVNAGNFVKEVLESEVPVIVDFWADWCNPCKVMMPVLEEIENESAGKVKVVKINADSEISLVHRHRITSLPTIVLFVNGSEVTRFIGARPKPFVLKEFKPFLP
jgi:thioredoxin 1